jgi:multimeric flavodoxin WrbA
MKIVCIVGSPHGLSGNSFELARWVLEGAARLGAEFEIALLDGLVLPCKGCDSCHREGGCPQQDGFEALCGGIEEADGVLLITPNYIESVSAQMKAFMDRCAGAIHRLAFSGKYGAAVVTSGGGDDQPIVDYLCRFLLMTGIRPVGGVHAAMASMPAGHFSTEVRERAVALGEELVRAWQEGRVDPRVEQDMAVFRNRMRQLIVWRKDDWPYEYGYWQEHHGLA